MLMINKNVELKASFEWIKASFNIFREAPLQFIVLAIFSTLIGLMPLFGSFMSPIFTAKFAGIAAKIEANNTVEFSSIFDDLFMNKTIINLGFINLCIGAAVFIAQYLIENKLGGTTLLAAKGPLLLLLFFIPVLLIQMAMWLAPIICLYDPTIKVLDAMLLSFNTSLYNVATLFLYGLLAVAFTILSVLPLGLGLLIWLPVTNITTYFIYKSMFTSSK